MFIDKIESCIRNEGFIERSNKRKMSEDQEFLNYKKYIFFV